MTALIVIVAAWLAWVTAPHDNARAAAHVAWALVCLGMIAGLVTWSVLRG